MAIIAGGTLVYLATGAMILTRRTPTRVDLLLFRIGYVMPVIADMVYMMISG
jgi:hypothetical protein